MASYGLHLIFDQSPGIAARYEYSTIQVVQADAASRRGLTQALAVKMKRREFLTEFLGALGAEDIDWHSENDHIITGRVIYDKNVPEEVQDFCWHKSENDVPSTEVLKLAKLLKTNELLSIDQISVTREELRLLYNKSYGESTSESEFFAVLNALEEIEIPMVDEGKETPS